MTTMDKRTQAVLQELCDASYAMQCQVIRQGKGLDPRYPRAVRRAITEIQRLDRKVGKVGTR